MQLNIMECRGCGASFWFEAEQSMQIVAGPCCKGLPILDIERFPTRQAALAAYPKMIKARERAIAARIRELEAAA